MHLITEPFTYAFFGNALLAGAVVGALCGALGVFVVLRQMSYIGQGLSQSVLGGVAPAAIAGVSPYAGAVAATITAGWLIHVVGRRYGIRPDAAIGIVATTMFAVGVAVVSANRQKAVNLTDLLFGNILGVTLTDIVIVSVTAAALIALLLVFFKPLVFATIDPVGAAANGIRVARIQLLSTIALAAAVVVSIRVVGVLLIAAVIVIPAATARLVLRSFGAAVATAAGLGAFSAVVGLFVSFHTNIASGPSIVLASACLFAIVVVIDAVALRRITRRAAAHHSAAERT
ncbi:MAG: metal ABC transporter permease [Actinomycetia bacterium]|nr:metal ABC transporter permease [Actinomycetes bacterium]MCH9700803.1 metal ABC transporter permease [Actinomycetes bacterium]MCH9762459.1 metal ABC transporter permease [Actinomycetes bacterium]